jgi:hypothetical protein
MSSISVVENAPDLDGLVSQLSRLYQGTGIRLSVEIGRLIIETLYGGDHEKWRSHGRKDVSFRKLEKHPQLPFRASTLSRAVSIYMISLRRADLLAFQHLSSSHLHELGGLSADIQDKLLERAESEQWSVQQLRAEVGKPSRARGHRTQSDVPGFARWFYRNKEDIEARVALEEIDLVTRLSIEQASELLKLLKSLLQQCEILARGLADRVNGSARCASISQFPSTGVPTSEHSSEREHLRQKQKHAPH